MTTSGHFQVCHAHRAARSRAGPAAAQCFGDLRHVGGRGVPRAPGGNPGGPRRKVEKWWTNSIRLLDGGELQVAPNGSPFGIGNTNSPRSLVPS